ncbi:LysR family transcriptional regulator [Nonomuraea sp. NPDC050540]|uniref:LysR family transcriptional regulator n=1 Tax=Nonomuraea sp. NPDC050540 TaxID=3364367 RepID=UPI0037B8EAD6
MDARQLAYFLAVVDHGGVQRAAEELWVAQPSVSQAIKKLERGLGTPLFRRYGRRLVLTPAGEALVTPARQVTRWLAAADESVAAVERLLAGKLTIAAMPSQAVSPLTELVAAFRRLHPGVQVSVRAADRPADVAAALRTGTAELGLIATLGRPGPDPELVVHPVDEQPFVLVAQDAADLPEGDEPVAPALLSGARLIVGQPGTGMRRAADQILAAAPGAAIAVEMEHREALLPLVLAGVGIAVVAASWRRLAEPMGLVVRDLALEEVLHVSLVHRTEPVSALARAFVAAIQRAM